MRGVDEDPKARSALKRTCLVIPNDHGEVDEDPKARSALKHDLIMGCAGGLELMKTPKHEVH